MSEKTQSDPRDEFIPDPEIVKELRGSIVLIKYGGNAMVEERAKHYVLAQIVHLIKLGVHPVIVHGGGPFIQNLFEDVGLPTEFIGGHRKTDMDAMKYVEMALSGQVNGEIIRDLNSRGLMAVGLTGKDAGMVRAKRRSHEEIVDGVRENIDLGYVGDVYSIDTSLINLLLDNGYLPVIAPIGIGSDHMDYNINADMFAGHMAGALKASAFIAMTNVDGLMGNPDDPDSRLEWADSSDIRVELGKSIQGGMIPKVESCLIALEQGVKKAHIVNGMKPDTLLIELLTHRKCGTTIESSGS